MPMPLQHNNDSPTPIIQTVQTYNKRAATMMDENDQHDDDANVDTLSKPNRIRSNSSISNANSTADSRSSIPEDKLVESLYRHLMESLCQDVASNLHQLIKMDDAIPSSWKLCNGTAAPTRRELYPELYNGNDENDNDDNDDDSNPTTTKKRRTDSEIQDLLKKYAVDLPKTDSPLQGNKRRNMAEEEEKLILLSKIQKEKESNYKDSDDEDETGDDENTKDDEDDDDEDFKMEDDDDDDDDDDDEDGDSKTKTKRSLSTTSETLSKDETTTTTTTTPKPSSSGLDIWGKNPSKEPKNRLCRCQLCGRLISTSRFASHLDKCMGLSTSRGTTPTPPLLGAHTKKRNGGSR